MRAGMFRMTRIRAVGFARIARRIECIDETESRRKTE